MSVLTDYMVYTCSTYVRVCLCFKCVHVCVCRLWYQVPALAEGHPQRPEAREHPHQEGRQGKGEGTGVCLGVGVVSGD